MSNKARDKEVKILKQVMELLSERDQGIQSAFGQFDKKVGGAFGALELKLGVIFAALEELGFSEDKLKELATKIQTQQGGVTNEPSQTGKPVDKSIERPTEGPPPSEGGGEEHFG